MLSCLMITIIKKLYFEVSFVIYHSLLLSSIMKDPSSMENIVPDVLEHYTKFIKECKECTTVAIQICQNLDIQKKILFSPKLKPVRKSF